MDTLILQLNDRLNLAIFELELEIIVHAQAAIQHEMDINRKMSHIITLNLEINDIDQLLDNEDQL